MVHWVIWETCIIVVAQRDTKKAQSSQNNENVCPIAKLLSIELVKTILHEIRNPIYYLCVEHIICNFVFFKQLNGSAYKRWVSRILISDYHPKQESKIEY